MNDLENMDRKMLEVLWIDDEWETNGIGFILNAECEGIDITAYSSFNEGIESLKKDPFRWIAVILDIREQAAENDVTKGFTYARDEIKKLQTINHNVEPYIFIFSGESEYSSASVPLPMENYASKKVYSKPIDGALLLADIKKLANVSPLYKLQQEHQQVLSIYESYGKNPLDLFRLIIQANSGNPIYEDLWFNNIRKILEGVIAPIVREHIDLAEPNQSLNDFSRAMGKNERIPIYIQRSFHSLVSITQNASHSLGINQDVKDNRAPYLLKSCLYELLNIVYWLNFI